MRVLFANLPWWTLENGQLRQGVRAGSRWPFTRPAPYLPGNFVFGAYQPFPFFLASAAGYVSRFMGPDCSVVMRDSIARGESYQNFLDYFDSAPPDVLVVETGAAAWEHDLQFLRALKQRRPGIRIAVGGPTADSASKSTEPGIVDAWLLGEYERNAVTFIAGGSGVLAHALLTKEEFATLPHPLFDDAAALNYWDACPRGQKAPHLQLFASRGCYYKCCFCAWPATMTANDPDGTAARGVRFYSPDWIEGFIRDRMARAVSAGTPLQSVYFDDDTFNLADKHVVAVCAVMKRIGLPWSAMCRADTSKPETWKAMKESGCFGVKLGFESGSQRVIDEIVGKKLDLRKAEATARWLRSSLGMTVHGTFTVGLPGETADERQQTVRFIEELYRAGAIDTHQLSGTATIENTPLDRIAHGEALKVFPGAKADAGFLVSPDGNMKLEDMLK